MSLNLRLLREENHLPSNHYSCHNFVVLRRANSFKMFWIRKPSFARHGIDHRVRFTVYLLATPLTIHFSIIIVKVSASLTICTVSYAKKNMALMTVLAENRSLLQYQTIRWILHVYPAMPCQVISYQVMSYQTIPHETIPSHTIPRHAMPCHAISHIYEDLDTDTQHHTQRDRCTHGHGSKSRTASMIVWILVKNGILYLVATFIFGMLYLPSCIIHSCLLYR